MQESAAEGLKAACLAVKGELPPPYTSAVALVGASLHHVLMVSQCYQLCRNRLHTASLVCTCACVLHRHQSSPLCLLLELLHTTPPPQP